MFRLNGLKLAIEGLERSDVREMCVESEDVRVEGGPRELYINFRPTLLDDAFLIHDALTTIEFSHRDLQRRYVRKITQQLERLQLYGETWCFALQLVRNSVVGNRRT